jgi:hypothetical protein
VRFVLLGERGFSYLQDAFIGLECNCSATFSTFAYLLI